MAAVAAEEVEMDASELLPLLRPSKFQELVAWGGSAMVGRTGTPTVIESVTDAGQILGWDDPDVKVQDKDAVT